MDTLYIIIIIIVLVAAIYFRLNRARILGKWGEKKVSTILGLLGSEYKVYNDVLIRNGNWTSQIDHVVVSPYGVFVIETKNYKGWIYGSIDAEHWTQNIWGNKNTLSNPIRQNRGHIIALSKQLPKFCDNQYIPLIVFSTQADIKTDFPNECNVIYTWQLPSRIKSYKEVILSEEQLKEFTSRLEEKNIISKEEKENHVSSVRRNLDRKNEMVNSGICPRCGGTLVRRQGKYGSFYGCSNYPKCTFTSNK